MAAWNTIVVVVGAVVIITLAFLAACRDQIKNRIVAPKKSAGSSAAEQVYTRTLRLSAKAEAARDLRDLDAAERGIALFELQVNVDVVVTVVGPVSNASEITLVSSIVATDEEGQVVEDIADTVTLVGDEAEERR